MIAFLFSALLMVLTNMILKRFLLHTSWSQGKPWSSTDLNNTMLVLISLTGTDISTAPAVLAHHLCAKY